MSKLEPTEAQRKAMAEATEAWNWYSCGPERRLDMVDDMIAAANSIAEGAPVGTVKQRPDGTFVAVRCGDVSPYPASWVYVRVMPGACEEPYGDDADSWPSYGEITPEPEGCGIGLDGECEGKCRKGYAPVGTIARRPDGEWIAWRTEDGWGYRFIGDEEPNEWPPGSSIADFWPQIRPDEWPDQSGLDWFPPGEEPIVPRPDPTAQQEPPKGLYGKYRVERVDGKPIRACFVLEYLDDLHANKALLEYAFSVERVNPELAKDLRAEWGKWPGRSQQEPGESLARGLDDLAAGRVSRRDDYLEPQQEPATTHPVSPESTNCVPKPRTPRVVDRLGVDERGSRWQDVSGLVWSFKNGWWRTVDGGLDYGCVDPSIGGPFKEILEPQPKAEGGSSPKSSPRVLPSLDCEEARDGTEWKFRLNGEPRSLVYRNNGWRYGEVGDRIGGRCGVSDGHAFIREFAPYIEVVGDPS
ncbi:Uncharacterised protein [Mycobacteroides abscessus subsp. abscessus]|uniref:Uncharacterized protein n=1 Tax=Mycobacteroides abscessus TaxID=36809 RepID=A0AB33T2S5_9MYCO|nr:Hypothetical protein ERS075527_01193 [Mycobacteroides abscessus]SIE42231.1 Uncharacterised protein [Mycobacteroides abscessus subsp. abscessus]CPT21231.1 Hypothetical protein ERS075531_01042 [Mycobacteroides abscessus]CPT25803.1 Hypothetical protein ERS075532_01392 [Mycobacteroides abscessus]CPU73340.1 Hypothetical protein ERS075567_00359 [Mycobacteroides abscessus]